MYEPHVKKPGPRATLSHGQAVNSEDKRPHVLVQPPAPGHGGPRRLLIPAPGYPTEPSQGFLGKAFACRPPSSVSELILFPGEDTDSFCALGEGGGSLQKGGDLRCICHATCSLLGQMAQVSRGSTQGAGALAGETDGDQEVTCSPESLF